MLGINPMDDAAHEDVAATARAEDQEVLPLQLCSCYGLALIQLLCRHYVPRP